MTPSPASELNDTQKIAVFRRMADAWHRKDWRACADLLAPQGVLHSVMLEPVVGRETFFQRISALAMPNKQVTLHIRRIGVVDGALFVERSDEVVIDGVSRQVPVVGVLEFDGPLIALWREYYDRAQLLRAQGKTVDTH
jgi:limonene-1,2-epoxide hydrolase